MSESLAKEINALWDLQRIHESLSEAYATQGHFEEAYNHHVNYKILSDSVFNKEKESEMNHLHFLQKKLENEELKHAYDKQQEQIKKQELLNNIYIFIGVVLVMLAYLLWRNLRLKGRMNRRLKVSNNIIESKNRELTLLNATKDRFFHMVAHDLKSPLSSMISFTDLLQKHLEQFDEKQIKEFLNSLHQSSSQGFKLLENLLDWARMQSNRIDFEPEKLKLYPLVDETLLLLESNAKSKDIRFNVNIDRDLMALIDRNMLLTVLRNLVSNAIKYSHPGSEISIQAEQLNEFVLVRVTDHGIGIPEEVRKKLFNIDTYFSRPGTNQEIGTGIGLILCHDFVKKWGGTILVESTEGVGSCFTITLPAF
jgi:signal transduction histidine kinase